MSLSMEAVPASVVRDSKGRVVKGSTLNAGGYTTREARMLRDLRALGPRAIAKLGKLLDDPNSAVALGAAREILDRNLGKVKQQVTVDVTSTHVLHLQALEELAARKKQQLIEAQAIDITEHATLDRIVSHDELPVIDASAQAAADDPTADPPGPAPLPGADANAPTPPYTHEK
jgi:hypothetical protein